MSSIKAVYGPEPPRQEEYPEYYEIGKTPLFGPGNDQWTVGKIYEVESKRGRWILIEDEDGRVRIEMNLLYVASLHYEP